MQRVLLMWSAARWPPGIPGFLNMDTEAGFGSSEASIKRSEVSGKTVAMETEFRQNTFTSWSDTSVSVIKCSALSMLLDLDRLDLRRCNKTVIDGLLLISGCQEASGVRGLRFLLGWLQPPL